MTRQEMQTELKKIQRLLNQANNALERLAEAETNDGVKAFAEDASWKILRVTNEAVAEMLNLE